TTVLRGSHARARKVVSLMGAHALSQRAAGARGALALSRRAAAARRRGTEHDAVVAPADNAAAAAVATTWRRRATTAAARVSRRGRAAERDARFHERDREDIRPRSRCHPLPPG